MERTASTTSSRRSFLRGVLGLGGAIAVLAGSRGVRAASAPGPQPPEPREEESRYRLTPHVRRYYETAAR